MPLFALETVDRLDKKLPVSRNGSMNIHPPLWDGLQVDSMKFGGDRERDSVMKPQDKTL